MIQVCGTTENWFFFLVKVMSQLLVPCAFLFRNSDLMCLITINHIYDSGMTACEKTSSIRSASAHGIRIQRQWGDTQQGHRCLSKELVSCFLNFFGINMGIHPDGPLEDFH